MASASSPRSPVKSQVKVPPASVPGRFPVKMTPLPVPSPGSINKSDGPADASNPPEGDGEKKKKKKKLPKAERQRRKEEAKMKSIYGPKDSHIQLISAATLQKLNAHTPLFSKSSFASSSVTEKPGSVTFSALDFPSFTPTQSSATSGGSNQKGPYLKSQLNQAEFPALDVPPLQKSTRDIPKPVSSKSRSSSHELKTEPNREAESKPTEKSNSASINAQKGISIPAGTSPVTAGTNSSEVQPKSEPIILGLSGVPTISNKKKSKNPLIISLDALITKKKPVGTASTKAKKRLRDLKSLAASKSATQTLGNILDSSGPMVIHRGKIREKPKKKKLTQLKKAILASRLARAENLKTPGNVEGSSNTLSSSKSPVQDEVSCVESVDISIQSLSVSDEGSVSTKAEELNITQDAQAKHSEQITEESSDPRPPLKEQGLELSDKIKDSDTATNLEVKSSEKDDILATLLNIVIEEQVELNKLKNMKSDTVAVEEECPVTVPLVSKIEVKPEVYSQAKKMLHNRKFRPYCDMYVSKELHGHVIRLMKELHRFQDRLYHTDPIKFQSKRRYVHGLKDASTYLQLNKVVLIILAPDMEANDEKGGLEEKIRDMKAKASEKKVPIVFSGNRYILGKPCFIKSQVSAIAILDKQGAEELFRAVIDESLQLRAKYEEDFNEKVQGIVSSQCVV